MARLGLQLGRTLFERRKEGMIPTEAGAILCAQSEKAMAILSGGIRRARGAGSGVADAYPLDTMAQLRALIALADAGGYISASAATRVSQPSLHHAVLALGATGGLTFF